MNYGCEREITKEQYDRAMELIDCGVYSPAVFEREGKHYVSFALGSIAIKEKTMRDCNNCVYSTRDGGCRKFTCEGTKTVEDIRADAIEEFAEKLKSFDRPHTKYLVSSFLRDVDFVAKQLKENKDE